MGPISYCVSGGTGGEQVVSPVGWSSRFEKVMSAELFPLRVRLGSATGKGIVGQIPTSWVAVPFTTPLRSKGAEVQVKSVLHRARAV